MHTGVCVVDEGIESPGTRIISWLRDAMQVLGIKSGSSGRVASVPNY